MPRQSRGGVNGDGRPVTVLLVGTGPDAADRLAPALDGEVGEPSLETVGSVREALDLLDARSVDCVVSAYDLPDGDGVEFLQTVRDRKGDVPFVLFAAAGDEAVASAAISVGASDYVRAGEDDAVEALADAVGRTVEEERRREDVRADVVDRVTDAVLSVDAEWRFTFVDERAAEIVGFDRRELLGERIWERFPELEGTSFEETYREVMSSREPDTVEDYFTGLDGWFQVNVYPDRDGGISLYFREVTDRRERERALTRLAEVTSEVDRPFEEKLRDLLEVGRKQLGLPYGFLTRIDEDGGTQTVVESRGEHDLLQPGEQADLSETYCRKTIATDGAMAVEDAEEEGWEDDPAYETFQLGCYIGANVVLGEDLYGTLCFAGPEDVTVEFSEFDRSFVELVAQWTSAEYSRVRSERDLKRQNERLEQFASVVSHDLRNPLNVLELSLEQARESGDSEQFDRAERAVERMNQLIEDLLELARSGDAVDDVETVRMEAVVEESWATVETGDATVDVAGSFAVRADRSRLQQLFGNLFRNAVEHGGDGVTVTVGELSEADGFYVEDDGPGIPEDERDEVFDVGYTTSEEGTGFGLSIVEDIATAHGWRVTATESAAGGARFEFSGVDVEWR